MPTLRQRIVSCLEVCIAICLVIAHNVYHRIPNEVPILFVLAIASFRTREASWSAHLFRRPVSWPATFVLAATCVALLLLKDLISEPIARYFWPAPAGVSSVISQTHDFRHALLVVLFVWVFAALGEEVDYRGYLLRRAVDVFGPSRWGVGLALLVSAVTFGFGHFYKGPAGILDSTGSGLILGGAYLLSRRLWASSLAHGVNDTLAIFSSLLGW